MIEELAVNAWPAHTVQCVDGWLLRHTPGVHRRRSNSLLPPARPRPAGLPVTEVLDIAESFYARRGLPLVVQVSPVETQLELDRELDRRGCEAAARTVVLTADIDKVKARCPARPALSPVVVGEPTDGWLRTWGAVENRGDVDVTRRSVLDRIGPPTGYAALPLHGDVAAVGLGVLERGWAGVFCMGTRPASRRQGAAEAVLGALAEWAGRQGARRLYLQVEVANAAARQLYTATGFAVSHSYHYRSSANT